MVHPEDRMSLAKVISELLFGDDEHASNIAESWEKSPALVMSHLVAYVRRVIDYVKPILLSNTTDATQLILRLDPDMSILCSELEEAASEEAPYNLSLWDSRCLAKMLLQSILETVIREHLKRS